MFILSNLFLLITRLNPLKQFSNISGDREKSDIITAKIEGSYLHQVVEEFLTNSGQFLVLKMLSDIIIGGWWSYFSHPPEYLMIFGASVQAMYLARPTSQRFWGNLIGVTIYTILDIPLDGWSFFSEFSHLIFWSTSLLLAIAQGTRYHLLPKWETLLIPLESIIRAFVIPAFYIVVKTAPDKDINLAVIRASFVDSVYIYFLSGVLLTGLFLGLRNLQVKRQQDQLRGVAHDLRELAEWGIGSYAVKLAVSNPDALDLQIRDRSVLFMDIRGFTHWCEQTEPKRIAYVLNEYYRATETAATQFHPIRMNLTADEVMAIYATPQQAIAAALAMRDQASQVLSPYDLGAGCAVHRGSVVEGLFGSEGVRTYTVIGDVVNTAKRLESSTCAGEITISDSVYQALSGHLQVRPQPPLRVKGKQEPLIRWQLC